MLKKPQEEPKQSIANRSKLPQEDGIRSLAGIKELLAMAEASRGSQIEIEWTTKNPGQIFVLDVQWDANIKDPFWALYEENAGQSKRVWAQPFAVNDIEMFYDILVMSCGAVDPSKNLSDILKVHTNSPKEDWSKPLDNKLATSSNSTPTLGVSAPQPSSVSNPNLSPGPSPAASNPAAVPNLGPESNPNAGFVPPYGFPPAGGMPINPAMFPMPTYNVPPNIQAMPIAMPYPPNMNQAGSPGMPGMQNPGWQYAPIPGGNTNQYGQPFSSNQSSAGALSALPIDSSLVNKQNDIALVDLLVKAQLLTEPILAAALKIQDLIQSKKLSVEKASEILNRYHSKGAAIEDYVSSFIGSSGGTFSTMDKSSGQESTGREGKAKLEDKEVLAAFELLKKAGLLSQDDIKTAQGVSRKHGGDIVSILQAAQKIDENTLEAAKICQSLEREGAMKLEQCVIVLNYCIRSRVSFDEAISELNWENPRNLKK